MILELSPPYYAKVKPLFHAQDDHPVIQSIIEGINPGRIFVDNVEKPTTALVWAKMEMYYLGGAADNDAFNRALPAFIRERIAPEARKIGEDCFQVELYPDETWQDKMDDILSSFRPNHGYRWASVFRPERNAAQGDWLSRVPEGYEVLRVDRDVLARDREGVIAQEIGKFWPTQELFFEKGLGYAAMKGDRAISVCISAFAAGREVEIGINTYASEERGKGLATSIARAIIDKCLATGRVPHWSTETFRQDSIRIAEKLGFEKTRVYRIFWFPYEGVE